jgi:hypothetical protein
MQEFYNKRVQVCPRAMILKQDYHFCILQEADLLLVQMDI